MSILYTRVKDKRGIPGGGRACLRTCCGLLTGEPCWFYIAMFVCAGYTFNQRQAVQTLLAFQCAVLPIELTNFAV